MEIRSGTVSRTGFVPSLSPQQELLRDRMRSHYREAGLQPPHLDDLPGELREDPAFETLLEGLEEAGELVPLDAGLYAWGEALRDAAQRILTTLAGQDGLGPADFKEVLPVSRRYLLPILRHFDGIGVTRNTGDLRAVQD